MQRRIIQICVVSVCVSVLGAVYDSYARNPFLREWGNDILTVDVMGLRIGMSRENIQEAWARNNWLDQDFTVSYGNGIDGRTQLTFDSFEFSAYSVTNVVADVYTRQYMQDVTLHEQKKTITVFYNEDERAVAIRVVLHDLRENESRAAMDELNYKYRSRSVVDRDRTTFSASSNINIEVLQRQRTVPRDIILYTLDILYYHRTKYLDALREKETPYLRWEKRL